MPIKEAKVALVDDHVLLRNGLASLVNTFGGYQVLFEASNGNDFIEHLKRGLMPELVLLDINMPGMDGYETALWIKKNHPLLKVLVLSMYDNENAIIRMFRAGAKGYVLKDCDPLELKAALDSVNNKGFYYSELVTGRLIHTINQMDDEDNGAGSLIQLHDKELEFLKLICSELTYKEIADKMFLSPRTIDGYRDALFEKLNCKTRVGLVMYSIKKGIVNL